MGHTPSDYLKGLSLENAATKAGIKAYHGTVKRMLENKHYLGDVFYPPIIDRKTFCAAQEERKHRSIRIPTAFTMKPSTQYDPNPQKQAEYLYSLIESEVL